MGNKKITEKNYIGLFDGFIQDYPKDFLDRTQKSVEKIELESVKQQAKPCPFCSSKDLVFRYQEHRGHGDTGYDQARIVCKNCSGSKGDGFGYGSPGIKEELEIWKLWNQRQ